MLFSKVAVLRETKECPAPPPDCHPKIRQAHDYWQTIRPAHGLPGRQHFDPTDVPGLLRHVRLLDVEGSPPRFKTRLVGTLYAERLGRDTTGCYLNELFEDFDDSLFHRSLMYVVVTGQPIWRFGPLQWFPTEQFGNAERIHLPFARDGKTVDMVMTVTIFQS